MTGGPAVFCQIQLLPEEKLYVGVAGGGCYSARSPGRRRGGQPPVDGPGRPDPEGDHGQLDLCDR